MTSSDGITVGGDGPIEIVLDVDTPQVVEAVLLPSPGPAGAPGEPGIDGLVGDPGPAGADSAWTEQAVTQLLDAQPVKGMDGASLVRVVNGLDNGSLDFIDRPDRQLGVVSLSGAVPVQVTVNAPDVPAPVVNVTTTEATIETQQVDVSGLATEETVASIDSKLPPPLDGGMPVTIVAVADGVVLGGGSSGPGQTDALTDSQLRAAPLGVTLLDPVPVEVQVSVSAPDVNVAAPNVTVEQTAVDVSGLATQTTAAAIEAKLPALSGGKLPVALDLSALSTAAGQAAETAKLEAVRALLAAGLSVTVANPTAATDVSALATNAKMDAVIAAIAAGATTSAERLPNSAVGYTTQLALTKVGPYAYQSAWFDPRGLVPSFLLCGPTLASSVINASATAQWSLESEDLSGQNPDSGTRQVRNLMLSYVKETNPYGAATVAAASPTATINVSDWYNPLILAGQEVATGGRVRLNISMFSDVAPPVLAVTAFASRTPLWSPTSGTVTLTQESLIDGGTGFGVSNGQQNNLGTPRYIAVVNSGSVGNLSFGGSGGGAYGYWVARLSTTGQISYSNKGAFDATHALVVVLGAVAYLTVDYTGGTTGPVAHGSTAPFDLGALTNAVTATISGTPAVSISGTPSVNASVSGTVNINTVAGAVSINPGVLGADIETSASLAAGGTYTGPSVSRNGNRMVYKVAADQAGTATVKAGFSQYERILKIVAVPAGAGITSESVVIDVIGCDYMRFVYVNGGTAQTSFLVERMNFWS